MPINIRTRQPLRAQEIDFVPRYSTKVDQFQCNPTQINLKIRELVWAMTDGRCYYCGVQTNPFSTFSIDHKIPKSRGGDNCLMNLVPACKPCNSAKRDRMLHSEWTPHGKPFYSTNEWTMLYHRYESIIDLCNCWEGIELQERAEG